MKSFIALATASALMFGPAAHAGDVAVEGAIHAFNVAFNKGDVAAARALHVSDPVIIDEVAPFSWAGPAAFDNWLAALTASEAAEGKTEGAVDIAPPTREVIKGDRAYVIAPATYSYK